MTFTGYGSRSTRTVMAERVRRAAELLAILGGIVLLSLVILTCASVAGRGLNTFAHTDWMSSFAPGLSAALLQAGIGPIDGDFELVEAGIAFAIFTFLPICQFRGEHAVVDLFTSRLPPRADRWISAIWESIFTLSLALISWRLWVGTASRLHNGDTTFLLQFPVWWSYAACAVASSLAVVVGLYCSVERVLTAIAPSEHLKAPGKEVV